jgi:hypothetical protein
MKYRYILIHYHIFKNAGSTVEWILEKLFGNSFRTIEPAFGGDGVVKSELVRFVQENREVAALSSHHFGLPAPRHERLKFVEICFLRHPLDRLQSMYHYYRRLENSTDITVKKALELSLPDYLRWLRANQPYNLINLQTCILGNRGRYFFPPSPHHLDRAVACMRELAVLGMVKRFDDSMIVAEHFMRPYFGDLDLSYIWQNTRPHGPSTLAERLDEMRLKCGDELYAEIEKWNQLDLQLFAAAEEEFERRLQFVPDIKQRRREFQSRCAALQRQFQTA